MKKINRTGKLIALLLAVCLCLGGCAAPGSGPVGNGENEGADREQAAPYRNAAGGQRETTPDAAAPMGRYTQTDVTPPVDGSFVPISLRVSDGALILSLYDETDRKAMAFTWQGDDWTAVDASGVQAFLDGLDKDSAVRGVWHGGGAWWVGAEEGGRPALYRVADSEARAVDLSALRPLTDLGEVVYIADVSVSGGRAVCCFATTGGKSMVLALDAATGALLRAIAPPVADNTPAVWGDMVYLYNAPSGTVDAYDLRTGEKTAQHAVAPPSGGPAARTVTADGRAVFLTMDGIFQCALDSSVTQAMVEEKGFVYATPHTNRYELFCLDEASYLVACVRDGALCVVKIALDASLPTQAARQLSVWALEDSDTIRGAAAIFANEQPDCDVNLTFGRDSASPSLTDEDIIRNLNTRLLAGEAPDVLFLDGLPIRSLMEKGILAPLNGIVSEEDFYENIFSAYTLGGTAYAYPAVFHIPLFASTSEEADASVISLETLADLYTNRIKIFNTSYLDIFDSFYTALSAVIFPDEKQIDEARLREFLQYTKEMIDGQGITEERNISVFMTGDGQSTQQGEFAMSLYSVAEGRTVCGTGVVKSRADALMLFGAGPSVQLIPLPGGGFEAAEIVSIPTAAAEPELAKAFVRIMLTDPAIQTNSVRQGFAVRRNVERDALAKRLEKSGAQYAADPVAYDWDDLIESLTAPSVGSKVIYTAARAAAFAYYRGDCTLDDAVAQVRQSLRLYFAEQGVKNDL